METTLSGKVAVVTGASSGIGRELARGLAERGANVLTISRPGGDGERVVEDLRAATRNTAIDFLPTDLSSMAEVRDVAGRVRERTDRIDLLLNNAGAYFTRRRTTAEGYEATFALNHLAPFLLTHLLAEPLLRADAARVVGTASEASRVARLRLDDPMPERGYNGWAAYGQSKLANLAFTTALARRFQGTSVTANAFHPGFVDSGFGSGTTFMNRMLGVAARLFARSPEKGAETGLYLALSQEIADVSGAYYADLKPLRPRTPARDPATTERLWALSEKLVGLTEAERRPLDRVRAAAS
jgi:NAD(P)-dependent dehydrogenase (short-subunit alcohol dehydrogenase family)